MKITDKKWRDFLDFCGDHAEPNHWFRGVKCASELTSKIGRNLSDKIWYPNTPKHGKSENLADREVRILEQFKRRAIGYLSVRPQSEFEWLALARHHGVPTRLLDWTTNPLVALWFATYPTHTESSQTAVVYAIKVPKEDILSADRVKVFKERKGVYYPAYAKPKFLISPYFHPRVQMQHGCFSLHSHPNIPFNVEKYGIGNYDIEKDDWLDFQIHLFKLGIDAATLYADLSGLGETLDWQYRNEKYIGVAG